MASRSYLNYIIIILMLTACSRSSGQELAAGNQAFTEADYQEAAVSYEKAMALDPAQGEPLYNLANTRYRQGIYTETHTILPQAAAIGSEELAVQSYFNSGNAHYQLKEWESAVEAYKKSLRLNPADTEAKYNLELAMRNLAQEENQQEQQQENQEQQNQEQQNQEQQNQESDQNRQENQEQQDQQGGEDEQSKEEEAPENSQQQAEEAADEQEEANPAQAQDSQHAQPLTPEQARQLLRAVGQNAETLQGQMQMAIPIDGSPPKKDW